MIKLLNWSILLLLVGGLFVFRPPSFGGQFSPIMVTGVSMEPTMFTGDLAVAHKQNIYNLGDVVAFRVEEGDTQGFRVPQGGGTVIHRIIGGNALDGFITQGDNNDFIDPWRPTPDQIQGKALFFVPQLGALVSYLQDPLRISIAVGVIFLYISMAGLVLSHRGRSSRELRRKRRQRSAERRGSMLRWLSI